MEESKGDIEEVQTGVKDCAAFRNYVVRSGIVGKRHPQELDEGTSLSLVSLPPLERKTLWLNPSFYVSDSVGSKTASRQLSKEQLEAILYIIQAHQVRFCDGTRQGFLLGDGTGCGKTMILAGLVAEYRLRGFKMAIWVTANQKLFHSAFQEIRLFDPSCSKLAVDFSSSEIPQFVDGVLFLTYKVLSRIENQRVVEKVLGPSFSGLIIMDEAHLVKTTGHKNGSTSGKYLEMLQEKYADARVVYSTATGASETCHLLYMKRLGLFGPGSPYEDKTAFHKTIDKIGVAGMELLAMKLKQRGVFIARQISYRGVQVSHLQVEMDSTFIEIYKRCCDLWLLLLVYVRKKSEADKILKKGDSIWGKKFAQIHIAALNFFEALITSCKIKAVAERTIMDLQRNRSVVIGIQKTGEMLFQRFIARPWNTGLPFSTAGDIVRGALRAAEIKIGCPRIYSTNGCEELGNWNTKDDKDADIETGLSVEVEDLDFDDEEGHAVDSKESYTLPQSLLRSSESVREDEPQIKKKKMGQLELPEYSVGSYIDIDDLKLTWSVEDAARNLDADSLARLYHELYLYLPINALDELYNRIESDTSTKDCAVANCTGKQSKYMFNPDKRIFERVFSGGIDKEMEDFMDLKKRVAIISDAASVGVSLHADATRKNNLKRTHITTQLPWSPVKLHQQTGRTHRSNQTCAPEYVIVFSPLAAEARFVSIVGQRLKQLGAICYGQSKACPVSEHMSSYLCSSVAQSAIRMTIDDMAAKDNVFRGLWKRIRPRDAQLNLEGQQGATKVAGNFFNRVLLLDPTMQEAVVQGVINRIEFLKARGQKVFSPMIEISASPYEDVQLESRVVLTGRRKASLELLKFKVDRVLSYKSIPKDDPGALGFFTRGSIPCFVVRRTDDPLAVDVFYPFARQPLKRCLSEFDGKKELDVSESCSLWTTWERRFTHLDGCIHTVMHTRLCSASCTLNYGVLIVFLLIGDVYDVLDDISEVFADQKESPQLGIVTCSIEGDQKTNIGLLLNKDMAAKLTRKLQSLN